MKILLIGAGGQLGTELLPRLEAVSELHAADIAEPDAAGVPFQRPFHRLDLASGEAVDGLLDTVRPSVIVNAAAYTAVDRAEIEGEIANAINADAPGRLARWAGANDAFLLHYSTDYVFDGKAARPYVESDEPSPLNAYGESKLAGEKAVSKSGCRHVILRTSWIYSAHGSNFVRTMLRLARERSHLSVVNDQHGCSTWALNLARVSRVVVERMTAPGPKTANSPEPGLYHYCDSPATTWYDFANAIFQAAAARGLIDRIPEVQPVASDAFQTAAIRPRNSVLDSRRIQNVFRIEPATLEVSLQACLEEMNVDD